MRLHDPAFRARALHQGPLVRLYRIDWSAPRATRSSAQYSPWPEISFAVHGAFGAERRLGAPLCDANTIALIDGDTEYVITHATAGRRRCLALLIEPETMATLLREVDPAAADRDRDRLFAHPCAPCDPKLVIEQMALARRAAAVAADPLEIEERALALARRVLRRAQPDARPTGVRASTRRAHRDLAERTRVLLNEHLDESLTLGELAARVHAAPTHLCTVFARETGVPIHRYRTQLRLAAGAARLADASTPPDLASLALDLGFAHHSHFTAAFRRAFGLPPSQFRRALHLPARAVDRRVRAPESLRRAFDRA